jgi:hypothetical protein
MLSSPACSRAKRFAGIVYLLTRAAHASSSSSWKTLPTSRLKAETSGTASTRVGMGPIRGSRRPGSTIGCGCSGKSRWPDRQTDLRTYGPSDRRTDRRTDRRMDRRTDRPTYGPTATDRRTDRGRTEGRTDGRTDRPMDRRTDRGRTDGPTGVHQTNDQRISRFNSVSPFPPLEAFEIFQTRSVGSPFELKEV